ncbi:MAG: cytochrome C [Candidatus Latescibacteria bacterium]|nr:cytochrome C [Candidatus Latescibacterota bacterium]
MLRLASVFGFLLLCGFILPAVATAQECIECHERVTPGITGDWQISLHAEQGVGCETCHGAEHTSAEDAAEAAIPTPETCANCHAERVEQFKAGKHAHAWTAMKAMPTAHHQPMALMEGMKGCGGCHKIGLKTEEEIEALSAEGHAFGVASCDACHTRHTFSVEEARQPQACQTCHMGFDHPQWEMYSSSKHGVRALLKQSGVLPEGTAAPTCQTCHMPDGDHEVRTAWGFLAVRLPMPEDPQWAADRAAILQGLGVLDPDGQPTARLDAVKAVDLARLTQEDWQAERDEMIAVCSDCHSENFARAELAKGDDMIREVDHLMAEGIRVVAKLYEDGVLEKPEGYAHPFPDLLTFHDAATPVEQRLFKMFLKHRMRAFQGTFHANPDYALWYGWSEMVQDLSEIRMMAEEMRARD